MIVGVQIFGCMKDFRKNPKEFCMALRDAGILQVEPCILFDEPEEFRQKAIDAGNDFFAGLPDLLWLPHEVEGFSKMLKDLGMYLTSAHCFYSDLDKCKDSMIETAKKSGITSYVFNTAEYGFSDKESFAKDINDCAIGLGTEKIELWLHNLGEDSKQRVGDISLYEWIIDNAPEIYAQPDTGWLLYGGVDPASFVNKKADRIRGVHFKDLVPNFKEKEGNEIFAVLGQGCVNTKTVLSLVKPYMSTVIDQDASDGDFIEDLKRSAVFLQYMSNII